MCVCFSPFPAVMLITSTSPGGTKSEKKKTKKNNDKTQPNISDSDPIHPWNFPGGFNLDAPVSTEVGKTQECNECQGWFFGNLQWVDCFPPGKKKVLIQPFFFCEKKGGPNRGRSQTKNGVEFGAGFRISHQHEEIIHHLFQVPFWELLF